MITAKFTERMRCYITAMECEAEAIRHAIGDGDELIVAGIGKVNAAAATQKAIDHGATLIVNVGLCGGFDRAMKVCDVYAVESAVEYDYDLAKIDGTRVGQKSERNSPYIPLALVSGLSHRILATGDRFNDSEADLELLKDLGCTLRDMEGAAIADVCDKNHISCKMVKCVSDVHGQGSMTGQYADNKKRALCALGEAMKWIDLG